MNKRKYLEFLKYFVISSAILILIVFLLWKYELTIAFLTKFFRILRPLIIGGAIAFIINRPVIKIQRLYKNLFDKNISHKTEDCLIVARLTGKALLPVPESYGYGAHSYFLRTQLNCVFDCTYCYLKGAFRNDFPVYFVNYDEIKEQITHEIDRVRTTGYTGQIRIYPSNRTDLVGSEHIGSFHQQFVPFFEQLDHVMIESRTKSIMMKPLLEL